MLNKHSVWEILEGYGFYIYKLDKHRARIIAIAINSFCSN